MRITNRNARFQVWEALLGNRTKRNRERAFLVQGVRPITLAVDHGWEVRHLLHDDARRPSRWAAELLERVPRDRRVAMSADLLAELGEKGDDAPELIAVVELPPDDLDRITVGADFLGVVFDRPSQPGNIGSIIRSADAFGARGLVTTGHAADVYDPKSVRASTGSLFAVPSVRAATHRDVLEWVERAPVRPRIVATDEHGDVDVDELDLTGPTLLLVGNETRGLSTAWAEAADATVRIPMVGAASSLNAANAATAVLYEAARQRRAAAR